MVRWGPTNLQKAAIYMVRHEGMSSGVCETTYGTSGALFIQSKGVGENFGPTDAAESIATNIATEGTWK